MPIQILKSYEFADITLQYQINDESKRVGMVMFPTATAGQLVRKREVLDKAPEIANLANAGIPFLAWDVDSLVQVKCVGDPYPDGFVHGRSMRNSPATYALIYDDQRMERNGKQTTIITRLKSSAGYEAEHHLSFTEGEWAFEVKTVLNNTTDHAISLEMLSSFSMGGITPYHRADAPNRLNVHRYRSAWSMEGRHECLPLEALHLERSWIGHGAVSERFGRMGAMPVSGFFPFVAVGDSAAGVLWGAQLCWAGSWQMEVYRKDDNVCISGGLADREFGHWIKTLQPGESLTTPPVILTTAQGSIDDLCWRLTDLHQRYADAQPAVDHDLPIVFNEWCTTWGEPTHENVMALADRLMDSKAKYLVIDAGWYISAGGGWYSTEGGSNWASSHGDWVVNPKKFPQGLEAACEEIRKRGLIPGLWFEMETCGGTSTAYQMVDHLLKRDGFPITVGSRRFWDMSDPFTVDWLSERIIGLLKRCGFGYLKIDHNDTIGMGCDGTESLGEGVRKQVNASYAFFQKIREALPDIVIENCSSGGHRLEPSMMFRTTMASFSDAHETREIPVIGANLHNMILPRQSQIWAVLHKSDDNRRLAWTMANTFLGRMCISGDIFALSEDQWAISKEAQGLYRKVWPIIKRGKSYRYGTAMRSWRWPLGWQAVVRVSEDGKEALAVVNRFWDEVPEEGERAANDVRREIEVPLVGGDGWEIAGMFHRNKGEVRVEGEKLFCPTDGEFSAVVVWLKKG